MKRLFAKLSALFVLGFPFFVFAAGLVPCGGEGQKQCDFKDLVTLANNIITFLLEKFAVPFAIILFMWAGFLFIFKSSSAGDVSKAKGIFWNVVFGFIWALAAFLIVKLILSGLQVGGDYTKVLGR